MAYEFVLADFCCYAVDCFSLVLGVSAQIETSYNGSSSIGRLGGSVWLEPVG